MAYLAISYCIWLLIHGLSYNRSSLFHKFSDELDLPISQMSDTTAQTANLPGGDKIAYLDSGPVPNSNDFTTLIIIHGMHFNACRSSP